MPLIDQPDTPELIDHQNSFAEGVVNNREPHLLTAFQAYHLLNVNLNSDGSAQKAGGFTPRGPANLNLNGKTPFGLFQMEVNENRNLIGRWANELYAASDNENSGPFSWTRLASNISFVSTQYMAVQGTTSLINPALFMVACNSQSVTGPSYSQVVALQIPGNIALNAGYTTLCKGLTWFQRRLWVLSDIGDLFWTKIGDGLTAAGGSVTMGKAGDDDVNMALTPLREPTPRLLAFRKKSIWLLDIYWTGDGFYPSTADTMDFTKAALRPITQEVGLVAPRAVSWVPGGEGGDYLFLSAEGIRSLNRSISDTQGGASLPLSWKIQRIIDRINWDRAEVAIAQFHNGITYFSVPIDGASQNNFTIAYDIRYDHFFFRDWEVAGFARLKYPGRSTALYFQASRDIGENYTNPAFTVTHPHVYDTSSGVGFAGAAVNTEIHTRAYSFDIGDPVGSGIRNRKRYNWLELGVKGTETTASFAISYKVNGASNWTSLAAFSVAANFVGVAQRRFSLRRLPPARFAEFKIQDNVTLGQPELEYIQISALPLNPLLG